HLRHGDKPTSEKHQKPLPRYPFLLFRRLSEQKGGSLSAAVLRSWSKTFQVPGQVQRSEPCQHSTAFSLRIAHYRPTSSVNGASANKISPLVLRYPCCNAGRRAWTIRRTPSP